MSVAAETEPELFIGEPEELFEERYFHDSTDFPHSYDIGPNGRLFMIKTREDNEGPTPIHVVLNWFEELKRLVPTP